nr:hypothetical protein [uncultured Rhodopila sp.]
MATQIDLKDADYHIPAKDMLVILQALHEGPYKLVHPVVANLERQISANVTAAKARDSFSMDGEATATQ